MLPEAEIYGDYSDLIDSTGFLVAALRLRATTRATVATRTTVKATANTHRRIGMW